MIFDYFRSSALSGFFKPIGKFIRLFLRIEGKDNVVMVVYRLIIEYKIKVTLSSVSEYLKTHTDYPSLKSICDFLNEMKIISYPLRINVQELQTLKKPFLAHLDISGGKIILIYSVNKETIVFTDSQYGKKVVGIHRFLEKWDGVVILVEPGMYSGEIEYKTRKAQEMINRSYMPMALLISCTIAAYGFSKGISLRGSDALYFIIILLTYFLGLLFSVLLIRNELNLKTKLSEILCHLTAFSDCDAVTKSRKSKLFGNITWADMGVIWFTGGLFWLFVHQDTNTYNILAILSFISLPYPVFSIIYQKNVIKKWCPLCLSVQIVLIVECVLLFRFINLSSIRYADITLLIIVYSSLFLFALLIKQNHIIQENKNSLRLQLLRIKRDPVFFNSQLESSEKVCLPEIEPAICMGNPGSKITITIFLSLKCSGCSRRFPDILNFLNGNNDSRIHLIFYPSEDELILNMFKVINELTQRKEYRAVLELLTRWYDSDLVSRIKLIDSFEISGTQIDTDELINRNSMFFEMGNVKKVPVIFINNHLLPDVLSLEDIRYHLNISKNENDTI